MSALTGKRALVTGASSGIGAAIAKLLAAEGVELVLSARRKEALERVAAECAQRAANGRASREVAKREASAADYNIHIVSADLGAPGGAAALWAGATASGPIEILVNNAGFGYFRPFTGATWDREAELLQLNIASLVELSRRFVDARAGKSDRAYLLNIASIAAYQSVPNFAVYAASKAFVRNFTEALHDEFAGTPLSATCVCPGGTHTEFHAQAGAGDYGWLANASMLSAEQVAALSVRAMRRGKRTVVTGFLNKLSCWSVRLVPRWFASFMATRVLGKPREEALPSRTGAA